MADEYGSTYQSDEQIGSAPPPFDGNIGLYGGAADPVQQTQLSTPTRAGDASARGIPLGRTPLVKPGRNEAIPYMTEEAYGDAPVPVGGGEAMAETAEMTEEIGNPAMQESAEEFYEATPEQLNAAAIEAGEEGRIDAESGEELTEAGVALGGAQEAGVEEFFPILAALVPTLLSSIGPTVAKKVVAKLSPRAKQGIKRLATTAAATAGKSKPVKNILSVFARLLESEQTKATGESGAEVGEELDRLIDEVAATAEVIIGRDDRVLATDTMSEPLRRICELRITFPNGKTYRGTGFFIGKRTLATAGHCVYLHNEGGWARKIEVIPGANGTFRPYGSEFSSSFRSVKGWVNSKKPEHDYGCIVLPANAFGGRNLGYFGISAAPPLKILGKRVSLYGYPGDKPSQNWGMTLAVKTITAKTLIYDIDTVGGQSGAPVYTDLDGRKNCAIAIHNYGNAGGNSATRITPTVFERLSKWAQL
jgi:glutamyl endopeptidase